MYWSEMSLSIFATSVLRASPADMPSCLYMAL